jgi:NAD(P)-dependent dehydrogenase (short-subunit alcohol dehydrogenase family)
MALEVNDMKIENSIALVTGANRGLGRAIVEALLARGARRVYAGARNPATLEALVRSAPDRVIPCAIDVTDGASLHAAAQRAADVELLINNAGVLASFDLLESSAEALAADFNTNAFGVLAATKAFLPALERAAARGPARAAVVNVHSVVSLASMPALGGYSASKAAAFSFTQALRPALKRRGIGLHAALPGAIDTDMVRSFEMPKTSPDQVARGILDGVVQGLDEITPDPMSTQLFATWQKDPQAVAQQLASM